ncbi:MAG: hypothetical protein OEV92_08930 [Nitrospinota bacterium]|nr:hypothetical protein [Nitrospinota bacterium]
MQKQIDIKKYLTEGWEMFQANMTNLIVATLIWIVVSLAASIVPFGGMVVGGPLIGGMFYIIMDLDAGEAFNAKRLFDGFTLKLVPLVLAGIITNIFILIGFVLLVIPGIVLFGFYLFTFLYIIDRDMDFWPAMEASRQFAFANMAGVILFGLAILGVNLAGALLLGVGLLVTIPVTLCATYKAYAELITLASDPKNSVGGSGLMSDKPKMHIEHRDPPPPPPSEKKRGRR